MNQEAQSYNMSQDEDAEAPYDNRRRDHFSNEEIEED